MTGWPGTPITRKTWPAVLRRQGIDLVEENRFVGFVDPHTLAADGTRTWSADRVVLAVAVASGPAPDPRR